MWFRLNKEKKHWRWKKNTQTHTHQKMTIQNHCVFELVNKNIKKIQSPAISCENDIETKATNAKQAKTMAR